MVAANRDDAAVFAGVQGDVANRDCTAIISLVVDFAPARARIISGIAQHFFDLGAAVSHDGVGPAAV